jgi:hypothetical protein
VWIVDANAATILFVKEWKTVGKNVVGGGGRGWKQEATLIKEIDTINSVVGSKKNQQDD